MGSVSTNQGSCELFEVQADHAWLKVGSATASHPKELTAEMLSKIWSIDHAMAARAMKVTAQPNLISEDFGLARNLGTTD